MASAVEPVRPPPQPPAGVLSEGTAACAVGAQVVHRARGGHVLVPSLDGGGSAGLQPVDPFLDDSGLPCFREWSRVVSAQSWAMVRGTMVRGPDGQSDPWL